MLEAQEEALAGQIAGLEERLTRLRRWGLNARALAVFLMVVDHVPI